MNLTLLPLLACPECRTPLTLDRAGSSARVESGTLRCGGGHPFPIVGGVPRFVQHELNADQARTRDSFGYEWTELYPAHGHTPPEWQAERDIFLEYTRTVPSDFKGKLVLDAGCGNGRYAKLANDWGARVVAVDISAAVEIAATQRRRPSTMWTWCRRICSNCRSSPKPSTWRLLGRRAAPYAGRARRIQGDPAAGQTGRHVLDLRARPGKSGALRDEPRPARLDGEGVVRTTWRFCRLLTAAGKILEKVPFVGPMLYLMGRQVLFFSPDQHNNFDHFSAGFTSFHRKEEIRGWYKGWETSRFAMPASPTKASMPGHASVRAAPLVACCMLRRWRCLGVIAWASPPPDRGHRSRGLRSDRCSAAIVRDCSDLHCFRVLVPWMLGRAARAVDRSGGRRTRWPATRRLPRRCWPVV